MSKIRIETAGQPIEFEISVAQTLQPDLSTEDEIRATLHLINEGERALQPLLEALKNREKLAVQLAAMKALELLHERNTDVSAAYPELVKCLEGQPARANAAVETFCNLGANAAKWLLQRIEKNPQQEVPSRLCEIIAKNAAPQDIMNFLRAGVDSSHDARRNTTASLIDEIFMKRPELANQEMIEIMYRLQQDPVEWVRRGACLGLARAPETVEVDFARVIRNFCWEDDAFMAFGSVLRLIGAQRKRARSDIPVLLDVRQNPPPGPYPEPKAVRMNVTQTLCMIDPDRMRDYLRELAEIENAVTSGMILITLDVNVAVGLLREWLQDERPSIVESAIAAAALNGLIGSELAPQIAEFLKSENKGFQFEAAKALRDSAKLLGSYLKSASAEDKATFGADSDRIVGLLKDQIPRLNDALPGMKRAATRKAAESAIKNIKAL